METVVDRFGRIVVPKKIRERLGLQPGAVLEIEESGDEIRLKPHRGEPAVRLKEGVLVFTGKALGDIEGAVRSMREERDRKIGWHKRR
jgi:AbrB family looped-hinge helix DNA binding protein